MTEEKLREESKDTEECNWIKELRDQEGLLLLYTGLSSGTMYFDNYSHFFWWAYEVLKMGHYNQDENPELFKILDEGLEISDEERAHKFLRLYEKTLAPFEGCNHLGPFDYEGLIHSPVLQKRFSDYLKEEGLQECSIVDDLDLSWEFIRYRYGEPSYFI
jgi:hypothetical protein